MFEEFSNYKTRYEKGQVFPFLIAIIAVVIILIMITVNLGQIGIFKTDVSNAADAAALAAASILSGTLLGFGLKSDTMCGYCYIEIVVIILMFCSVIGIPLAIVTALVLMIHQLIEYAKANNDCLMAWANAKKTALQYAFNNVGVDEPRPTFRQFLIAIEEDPDNPSNVAQLYEEYTKGETGRAREYARSGFSKFMDDSKGGFWDEDRSGFDEILPACDVDQIINQGYGWTQLEDDTFINSYEDGGSFNEDYENYVGVEVMGIPYTLMPYDAAGQLLNHISDWIEQAIDLPWWLEWMDEPIQWVLSLASGILATLLICGLSVGDWGGGGLDAMREHIDGRYITVTVTRYKRSENLGLWNFRYGTIKATAVAHPFGEVGDETIEPTSDLLAAIIDFLANLVEEGELDFSMFNTREHLFETELTGAF